jgi:hypothetical protein
MTPRPQGRSPEFVRCDNGPEFTANALGWSPLLPRRQAPTASLTLLGRTPTLSLSAQGSATSCCCRDFLLPPRRGHGRELAPGLQRAPATLSTGMQPPARFARAWRVRAPPPRCVRPTGSLRGTATPLPCNMTTTTDPHNGWTQERGPV